MSAMLRKHSVLLGIAISLLLLVAATLHYPGGSRVDQHSIGYDWKNNYLSNLFGDRALNGADNSARPWAISAMFLLCGSSALFFIEFSKKISAKGAANVIRFCGAGAMLFFFLAVTPYHDTVITTASILCLLSMFYITVFVFKSRLHLLKVLSAVCLLIAYGCNYVYYTRSHLELLPILQKIALLITIAWILSLEYFTTRADFL